MNDVWGNPINWTSTQWLAVLILVFTILAVVILMQRLFAIIKSSQRQTYKPNLRRLRRLHPDNSEMEQQGSPDHDNRSE